MLVVSCTAVIDGFLCILCILYSHRISVCSVATLFYWFLYLAIQLLGLQICYNKVELSWVLCRTEISDSQLWLSGLLWSLVTILAGVWDSMSYLNNVANVVVHVCVLDLRGVRGKEPSLCARTTHHQWTVSLQARRVHSLTADIRHQK